jgi:uncharacterized membrane protein YphA (DoxX/SURF4 family)
MTSSANAAAGRGLALARVCIGAMFVYVFFENYGKGLYTPGGYAELIKWYAENGNAPHAWKSIMGLAAENARIAAPLQGLTEFSFGVLLVLGAFTRPVAFAAGAFLTSLWVSEWGTAWVWELLVPLWTAFAVSIGAGGRTWGIDARLAAKNPNSLLW